MTDHSTITINRITYTRLLLDANSWRLLNSSSYICEILAEWVEWDTRRRHREASHAVSALAKEMGDRGYRWLSYAELERRRRLVSINPCDECGTGVEMVHPFLDENWNVPPVRCGTCAALEAGAA